MVSEAKAPPPADFDENPEWTEETFAKARPASDFPELVAALRNARGPAKQPTKRAVSIRLSPRVLDYYRAQGAGWQTRLNADLEGLIGKNS